MSISIILRCQNADSSACWGKFLKMNNNHENIIIRAKDSLIQAIKVDSSFIDPSEINVEKVSFFIIP